MADNFKNLIYLGRSESLNHPVFVALSTILKGMIIFGSPGSGKSVKLANLLRQLIRTAVVSVSVFNLKPLTSDLLSVLLHEVQALRERNRKRPPGTRLPYTYPLWLFSLRRGRSSHLLNPFKGEFWEQLAPGQQAQLVLKAMSFSHSRSFEQAFFGDSARKILEHVFERAKERGEVIRTFGRLHELLTAVLNPRYKGISEHVKTHGAHPTYVVERLAKIESLGNGADAADALDSAIDPERFVREPCFAYYDLDPFTDPEASGEVCRLAVDNSFSRISAISRSVAHIILIDEFAIVIAASLAQLFRQARETNCGLILATQSVADLKQDSMDLTDTILNTTPVQVFMRVTEPAGMRLLRELGGTRLEHSLSVSHSRNAQGEVSSSTTVSETLVDRINVPEIERVNSDNNLEFMRIIGNEGPGKYNSALFVNRWDYDRDYKQYKEFCKAPWPEWQPGMIVVGDKGPRIPGRPDDEFDDNWEPEELGLDTRREPTTA